MSTRQAVDAAVEYALSQGAWRAEDLEALLLGCARDGDGRPIACCTRCLKPEYVDGLIATETLDLNGMSVVSGDLCPQCRMTTRAETT